MKIAVKEVGKDLKIIESNEKYRIDCIKEHIGKKNFPSFISLNNNKTLSIGVCDDGLLRKLPLNFHVSCDNPFFPIEKIVGTAVFTRIKPVTGEEGEIYDYEITDLTDEDILLITELLKEETQKKLEMYDGLVDKRIPIGFIPVKFEVIYNLQSNLAMAVYQMACAALSNGMNDFYMPMHFIQKLITYGKQHEQFEESLAEEDILHNVCEDISKKANISLAYSKTEDGKTFFTLEKTVIVFH